jgi:hypothetical protein
MGRKLGVIAGSGEMVSFLLGKFHQEGNRVYLAAIKDNAPEEIISLADEARWFSLTDFYNILAFFKDQGVAEVFMVGKIDPAQLFRTDKSNFLLKKMLALLPDRHPKTLINLVFSFFENQGIKIGEVDPYLEELFLPPGVLTRRKPTTQEEEDARFALPLARKMADLEIGQTIVVKNKAVVAVEAMEGTDEAVLRAGDLVGSGTVVVKVGRTHQDNRIDLPVVGLSTIKSMIDSAATALFLESGKVAFIQANKAIELADSQGIAIKVVSFLT